MVPGWIRFIGGRRVAPYAAIIPATLGGLSLIAIWDYGFRDVFSDEFLPFSSDAAAVLIISATHPSTCGDPHCWCSLGPTTAGACAV